MDRGITRKIFVLAMLLWFTGVPWVAFAGPRVSLVELSASPYWQKLLHLNSTWASPPEGGGFLLSPSGSFGAAQELEATLSALKAAPVPGQVHASCRFPLRAKWLKSVLPGLESQIPAAKCLKMTTWLSRNRPDKITLVYAASFLENPASAFGHIFLRLESQGRGLSAPMVQFAAITGEATGFEYLLRGAFGGFKGYYIIEPQHTLMRNNLELEGRDLWVYDLQLSADEQENLLFHLWEMRQVYFDYYFFNQNCGYRLIELIELARFEPPEIPKTRVAWSIPTDNLKNILSQVPETLDASRLSSRSTRWQARLRALDEKQLSLLDQLLAEPEAIQSPGFQQLNDPDKVEVLDALNDYYRIQINSRIGEFEILDRWLKVKEQQKEARKWRMAVLIERSKFKLPTQGDSTPEAGPESSHPTAALRFTGWQGEEDHQTLRIAAYDHDLLSSSVGQLNNARFRVLDLAIDQRPGQQAQVSELTLFEVLSLNERGKYFSPLSWRMKINLAASGGQGHGDLKRVELTGQGGWTYALLPQTLGYFLGGVDLNLGPDNGFLGNVLAGVVYRPVPWFGVHGSQNNRNRLAGQTDSSRVTTVEARVQLADYLEFGALTRQRLPQPRETGLSLVGRF